jgi:Ran GTPase-activating protein (RanGAP) involved in mRNA processing and transport
MIELMRKCISEPSYTNMIMEKFYDLNFSEKEHADVKTIVDSDNDFKELFEDFNVAIIQSLNAVVDKANKQTEEEDRKEKERIKKPAKV